MRLRPGQRLSHYRIVGMLGRGGMGSVYRAEDTRLDREVAIKVLPPEVTADPERRGRFDQEARLAATFNHPNIATIHDVGEEGDLTFIVMEAVPGDSLRKVIGDGPLPVDRVLEIAEGIAAGLARAHRDGVVHRDLKPGNIVLTEEGRPKIVDFGLGKFLGANDASLDPVASESPTLTRVSGSPGEGSPYVTRAGQVIGTLAYMSPEQLQGLEIDARTDVFSFGIVLYELLAGRRPFAGESEPEMMTAILRDEPLSPGKIRDDVPGPLLAVLERCLRKDPGARYRSGVELHEALHSLRAERAATTGTALARRRALLTAAIGLVMVLTLSLAWLGRRAARESWARGEALPEVERLAVAGDWDGAVRLLREIGEIIPEDPRYQQSLAAHAVPVSIDSEPSGAEVFVKGYPHVQRSWIPLGQTPLEGVRIPMPARFRVEKEGFAPFEGATGPGLGERVVLFREGEAPEGMVRVPTGRASFGSGPPVEIESFWIDRYEVTNRQFQAFVDDGGYRSPELWTELPADEMLAFFVDDTGRPGPAGWELGAPPEGTDDEPVGGISWYEAAAYAAWAGKSLPTVYHWRRAAQPGIFSEILLSSNFDGEGPAPVGKYPGLGPVGTYDMAGNVREWCLNRSGERRYVLGGTWSDPPYNYGNREAADPLDRSPTNGLRLILTDGPLAPETTVGVDVAVHDFAEFEPVDDEVFEVIRGLYRYDRSELDVRVEDVGEETENWRREVVSIRTAYGDERLPIHLYLPKNSPPPYQTVVFFPATDARLLTNSRYLLFRFAFTRFVPRSGRALVYPIYQGTYERRVQPTGPNDWRDLTIQVAKDLQRTIDYLETRDDIDASRLAFYGHSWGGALGPLLTAVETRFKASVLLSGGLRQYPPGYPPEAIPLNFAPRSTVPVLMINGRNDLLGPLETEIEPMFAFQGAPDEHKKLVILDGGHVPGSSNAFIREILDWLDTYLGPVGRAADG